jgi:hypothetical protein
MADAQTCAMTATVTQFNKRPKLCMLIEKNVFFCAKQQPREQFYLDFTLTAMNH